MRRYSEAVKADIRKPMPPPASQSVTRISEETGIHICTLYVWRKAWRLEGEVVPAFPQGPRGLKRCRQVHGGNGERWAARHRTQRLLPGVDQQATPAPADFARR